MTTQSDSLIAGFRAVAVDSIATHIWANDTFSKKQDIDTLLVRLFTLESKVQEVIDKCWSQEMIGSLAPPESISASSGYSALVERIDRLESKIDEIKSKCWTQEPFSD